MFALARAPEASKAHVAAVVLALALPACSRTEEKPPPARAPAVASPADAGLDALPAEPWEHAVRLLLAEQATRLGADHTAVRTAALRVFTNEDVVVVEWGWNGARRDSGQRAGAAIVDVLRLDREGGAASSRRYADAERAGPATSQALLRKRPPPELPAAPTRLATRGTAEERANVELARDMDAAFDAKNEMAWLDAMTEAVVWEDMTQPGPSRGKAEAARFMKELTRAFPDRKTTSTLVLAAGDLVIAEKTWTGTQKAAFFGEPPLRKPVTVKGLEILRFAGGKLVEGWAYPG